MSDNIEVVEPKRRGKGISAVIEQMKNVKEDNKPSSIDNGAAEFPMNALKIGDGLPVRTVGLATRESGVLALQTLGDQLAFAKRLIDDKMISTTFETPQQVVIGIQYAKALQIPEILALKMMYVQNGKPTLYAEGPLALVQRSPKFLRINEYFVDEEGERICPANKNLKERAFEIGRAHV